MLSDFGSSEARNSRFQRSKVGTTGTLDYLAPESFTPLPNGLVRPYSAELDLWALGTSGIVPSFETFISCSLPQKVSYFTCWHFSNCPTRALTLMVSLALYGTLIAECDLLLLRPHQRD